MTTARPRCRSPTSTVIGGVAGLINAVFTVSLSVRSRRRSRSASPPTTTRRRPTKTIWPQSGILTFMPGGPLIQTITVPVLGSAVPSPTRRSSSTCPASPAGDDRRRAGLGTIVRQGLTIGNVSVVEGNSGTTDAVVHGQPVAGAGPRVTVALQHGQRHGHGGQQRLRRAPAERSTFAIGETSKTITVAIVGDTTVESNETFFVNLSNATGSVLFNSQGTGTILNDDGQRALDRAAIGRSQRRSAGAGADAQRRTTTSCCKSTCRIFKQSPNGIAAAYLDALYDSNLVSGRRPDHLWRRLSEYPIGQHRPRRA